MFFQGHYGESTLYYCKYFVQSHSQRILEKFNLKLAIHSIENIGRNHKPAFISSADKKTKFYGKENSTKQGAKKEVAMMVIKHQSELANVKADHERLRKDYDKLSAVKKQLKNAITQSEKSTDMLSEDLNTDLPRTIASISSFISNGATSICPYATCFTWLDDATSIDLMMPHLLTLPQLAKDPSSFSWHNSLNIRNLSMNFLRYGQIEVALGPSGSVEAVSESM
ncbi:hypothetical protein LOK49_LG03G02566 [Camellia lanceoleosa]|uniref:Uncharacterized protein n=1 Tax=Camellia lanceoleosa TaxID=1840588 RepID=A0ACC0IDX3_9ERIC|nr:hypothetical protein LOK49_LG03G02566 [Camellia lanceoleosa]